MGQPFQVFVKGQDAWGNPARILGDGLQVSSEGLTDEGLTGEGLTERSRAARDGTVLVELAASTAGVYRVQIDDAAAGLRTRSNPVRVGPGIAAVRHYWGDMHTQSGETIGTKPVDEYLGFARDMARLDFICHQANDFQITAEIWSAITAAIAKYHERGRFITFNGYEWSGLTGAGGDRNVVFRGDYTELRRSGHWQIEDLSDVDTDCYPVTELYAAFDGRDDVLLIPHVGGRYADMAFHNPKLEPLVEITSTHGEFEWLYADALAAGGRVGVTCGSDDHTGRPGASYPGGAGLGLKGGLLCLLASELTREELWSSLRRRACYGSTAGRLLLDVRCHGKGIGDDVSCDDPPEFEVSVAGTAGIERIELRAGMEIVDTFPRAADVTREVGRLRVAWRGARHKGRGRAARWDGHVQLRDTKITVVSTYAFDTSREGVTSWDEQSVHWRSTTRGDCDGLVLELREPRGLLEFRTDLVAFDCDLSELNDVHTVAAGGLGLQASVEWLPRAVGLDVTTTLVGRPPGAAPVPHQVVVIQDHGTKAWSSPIWVSQTAPASG